MSKSHRNIANIQLCMFSLSRGSKAGDWLYRLEGHVPHGSVQSCQDKKLTTVCTAATLSCVRYYDNAPVSRGRHRGHWSFARRFGSAQQPSQSFVISPSLTIFKLLSSSLK